jgi:thiol-disulfide isomerase/thioredoxin
VINAQHISGRLKYHTRQQITLFGYENFGTVELGKTTIDSVGNFSIEWDGSRSGMGYLETSDKGRMTIVLNDPQIEISGPHFLEPDSIVVVRGNENKIYKQYITESGLRQKAVSGWAYLQPIYEQNDFMQHNRGARVEFIEKEIEQIEAADREFIEDVDESLYMSWYLPVLKLYNDMALSSIYYKKQISGNTAIFRNTDLSDKRFYNSGLLGGVIERHYVMLDSMDIAPRLKHQQMNASTDYIIENFAGEDALLGEIANRLFNFLETKAMFEASEYFALRMLDHETCVLEYKLANQMESYRAMKPGNTAPEIIFSGLKMRYGSERTDVVTLSGMGNRYTLMVFGAASCKKCAKEIPMLLGYYNRWKNKGLEIVFVSLDDDEKKFRGFVKKLPWLSYCDFNGWNTQAAKDFYVFSSPLMFLLDEDLKILSRPTTPKEIDELLNNSPINQ